MRSLISSRRGSACCPSPQHDGGFTLAEVLVTFAVIAVLIASALELLNPHRLERARLEAAATQLMADFRSARNQAVFSNASVTFQFDVEGQRYKSDRQTEWQAMEEGVVFDVPDQPEAERLAVTFYPDGHATGEDLRLVQGEAKRTISFLPLTGRVRLDP